MQPGALQEQVESQFIIARMRSSFVFVTMFPRFATGAANNSVCFPPRETSQETMFPQQCFTV